MDFKSLVKNILFEESLPGTAIFVGRFQPLTAAHYSIIDNLRKSYRNVFVVIVAGKTKKNNPLTLGQRVKLISKAFGGKLPLQSIIKAPTGFTPDILDKISRYISKEKLKRKFILAAGEDRIDEYKRQINEYYKGEAEIEIKMIPREEESISATKVRQALMQNNEEEFRRLMPQSLWDEYESLRKLISNKNNELIDNKIINEI